MKSLFKYPHLFSPKFFAFARIRISQDFSGSADLCRFSSVLSKFLSRGFAPEHPRLQNACSIRRRNRKRFPYNDNRIERKNLPQPPGRHKTRIQYTMPERFFQPFAEVLMTGREIRLLYFLVPPARRMARRVLHEILQCLFERVAKVKK